MNVRWPTGGLGLPWLPFGEREEVALVVGEWAGGWIETGLIGPAGPDGVGEGVVDCENGFLGAEAAIGSYVLALHDGERLHYVVDGVARRGEGLGETLRLLAPLSFRTEVEVKKGGI